MAVCPCLDGRIIEKNGLTKHVQVFGPGQEGEQ